MHLYSHFVIMATIVLGSQWGDEGKGKIVDVLSEDIQLCCRAQGGHNAGHTIVKGGTTFDVHILPSGVLTEGCVSLIGSGCVVYVPGFFKELNMLETHGIAPTYSTKATRSGVRVADIFNKQYFDEKVRHLADGFKKRYGDLLSYDVEDELKRFDDYRERLKPFVVDQVPLIESAVKGNVRMLVEGANALMLDIDNGTYPYVTSSNTGLGGIFTGLHLSPRKVKEVIGVVKAYTTRVGGGPFPSEQLNEFGERLQSVGKEFGVTTGRKRRCGWLDLVLVKFSHTINWYDCFNLTKLDILDDFDEIKVATEYRYKGEKLASFPADLHVLDNMEVIYQTFPGWKSKTVGLKKFEELPVNARKYIEFIEEFTGVKCKYIGTGPGRESMIVR
ncbi:hypothetical protein D0867_13052 [Hortaea werneckii]|uniref:Adenylosuccinate synthetase n=2 Tax=Hortaea werneckii TaxID=91943 RepID=A0A3M6Y1M6_HORWE|nr:hypothetical protein D0867_13052 [Hortaea werneckii]